MTSENTQPNPNDTLRAGREVRDIDIWNEGRRELHLRTIAGETVSVTIKKVGLKDMNRLLEAQGDEAAVARLYTEEPTGAAFGELWDSLDADSQMTLLEKGDELNLPLFARWLKRRTANLKAQGIDLEALTRAKLDTVSR